MAQMKASAASLAVLLILLPVHAASPKRLVIDSIEARPNLLWPPNHKLVPVTVGVVAEGGSCAITAVASDDPGDQEKHGPDWVITSALTVDLRAERSGSSDGRHYTISVKCNDRAGNASDASVVVTVPHDKSSGEKGTSPKAGG